MGHVTKATSTTAPPVSIVICSPLRESLVAGALARFSVHASVTLPNFGMARAGNRG